MDSTLVFTLAMVCVTVVAVFFEVQFRQWLKKVRLFAQLLDNIVKAAKDDKISEEELKQIIADAKQVVADLEGA